MTFVIVLLMGAGVLLIISAMECTSLIQTTADVWSGAVAGYTWQCGGANLSGGTKNPCALATPYDWCNKGGPCYDANKCAALQQQQGLAGPASSTPPAAARLVPWVRQGWGG